MTDFEAARVAMVDSQVRPSDVTSLPIIEAMLHVPRERFVPAALRPVAYAGEHVRLSEGRVLLDPRVFAKMLDAAEIGPDDLVLDVACGFGYSTAVISRLCAATVGLESDAAMAARAAELLAELECDNAQVKEGPLDQGVAEHAPYDVIFVNGGVEVIPDALAAQLREGGRLVAIEMRGVMGSCAVWTRAAGTLSRRRMFDAAAPVLEGFRKAPEFVF
ncbi:protein-L-isoaspartate O-methyltransferase family protein [Oceanicella actignis]|uniref:Protein-L-isoaspartate O-methyltransferase n=1 Tax=Oceanicella actignis TaxID=1189325 RepID=A0A1M7SCL5_9RHOB|nr:protein-L-isoaspartate O-methyltransferase [Oceanicella actignis]SET26006.1 protein-L-isoaspartate(D-aspartate) O-methyltransferase [Oceanicella actignis]SHN56257.1 protein-L-isoaspartate(D-aspartate) O-methyltransferase [Oceanicella actignis]